MHLIKSHFLDTTLDLLQHELLPRPTTCVSEIEGQHRRIHALTGALLSTMLYRGASLESLYSHYKQVLLSPRARRTPFRRRFSLLRKLVTATPDVFDVAFVLHNVTQPEKFPLKLGAVTFTSAIGGHAPRLQGRRLLQTQSQRLYATLQVHAKEPRSAGVLAYSVVNDALDLIRFDHERSAIQMSDEFLVRKGTTQLWSRLFPIPKIIPNPQTTSSIVELEEFVNNVRAISDSSAFHSEGVGRIQAAFRLHRVGADTHVFENKLVNWWTAIESLVRGTSGEAGIGAAVEKALIPTLCLGYLGKLLTAYRTALVDAKATACSPGTTNEIRLSQLSKADFYSLLASTPNKDLPNVAEPYVRMRVKEFAGALSSKRSTAELIRHHEQRLRWHIQRIWRARCDIVHSARRLPNAALLCANLEFYLKTILSELLRSLSKNPGIETPKEFFDRQTFAYGRAMASLDANDDQQLISLLNEH